MHHSGLCTILFSPAGLFSLVRFFLSLGGGSCATWCDLNQFDSNIFNFIISLFGLFHLIIRKDKETDHAGFWFNISILGLDFTYRKYDIRHWDWENDTWEVYE